MKQNPYLTVYGVKRRKRAPRLTARDLAFIKKQVRKEPKGTRVGRSLLWRDRHGRYTKFTPAKPLRGVVEIIYPRRRGRLTKVQRQRRAARRINDARRRLAARLKLHLTAVRRLAALALRYPARLPHYLTIHVLLQQAFPPLRDAAIPLGGPPLQVVRDIEAAYVRLHGILRLAPSPGQWFPAASIINGMIGPGTPYNLPAEAWDAEVDYARRQYPGVRPLELAWVWNNDPLSHPLGSANLLIREDELDPRLFNMTVAPKWTIFALCKLPPEWDGGIEHGQLVRSPEKDLRKSPYFYKRRAPGTKYVVLGCPIVYRREMVQTPQMVARGIAPTMEREKNLREIHAFLHTMVPLQEDKPFSGQEVWKENFQRFYWSRKKYVYPILFLGYTPRTEHRLSMAATRAEALKEVTGP